MITGDTVTSANAIAQQIDIDNLHVKAAMRPIDKLEWVHNSQKDGRTVLVIGDGINDGPMLAQAHVGVAMGECGTALAVHSAGVCIMDDDLMKVSIAINIAKECKRIIIQNIVLSVLFKFIVMVISVYGFLHLWIAVLADVGSLLLVMVNGLRLNLLIESKNKIYPSEMKSEEIQFEVI